MEFALGYRLEDEDHDWLAREAVQPAFMSGEDIPTPKQIDVRNGLKLHNQLRMGSCGGHAGVHAGSMLNWIASSGTEWVQFSRMFTYIEAQRASGFLGRDQGCSITGVVQSMLRVGLALESQYPYPAEYTTKVPAAAKTFAASHRIEGHVRFQDFDQIVMYLAQKLGAIVIGIPWTDTLQNAGPVVEANQLNGRYLGGHALAVCGYSARRDSNGDPYLWVGNSHGPQWANKGWSEWAPTVFKRFMKDPSSEVIGVNALRPVLSSKIKLDMDK